MGTEDFSVAAWVKMGSSQKSYPTIVSKGGTSSSSAGYWFYISGSKIKFTFGDGTQRLSTYSNTISVLDNNWHHIAVSVKRNGTAEFYLDGASVGNYSVSSFSGKNISNASKSLYIGSTGSSTSPLKGNLDDVRVYKKALSNSEVADLANSGQTTNNDTYITHWAFDETSGTTAIDSSSNHFNGTLKNGPTWSTGIKGNSLKFDGVNDRVECGSNVVMDMGTGDFSISSWVKMGTNQ